MADYLRAQVEGGVQAVQLFDSWIGALDEADYREFVLPHVRRIFDGIADLDVPKIHFGTGTGHLLAVQREAGGTVIGVDWRTPLDEGWTRAGDGVARKEDNDARCEVLEQMSTSLASDNSEDAAWFNEVTRPQFRR